MKATYMDLYKKKSDKTGEINTVFRYLLSGTEADLTRYRDITEGGGYAVHTDEDSGKMIYFTTIGYGTSMEVVITATGKIVVPNVTLDVLQSQMKLANDPAIKSALAGHIAQFMVDQVINQGRTATAVAVTETVEVEQEEDETPVKPIKATKKTAKADPAETNLDD